MKILFSTVFAVLFLLSSSAFACGWGTKSFACCTQASAFPNSPYTRKSTGCAISRADATARCLPYGVNGSSLHVVWDGSQCPSTGGGSSGGTQGHACSVARRGSDSFTYYSYETRSTSSKEELCQKARDLVTSGNAVTHWWYTTFTSNKMHKAIAECENGSWTAYGVGIDSIKQASELRRNNGGRGCLYKVDKTWTP